MLKISKDVAEKLYEADKDERVMHLRKVDDIYERSSRWMECRYVVFLHPEDMRHYAFRYEIGLTEMQPNDFPWESDYIDMVECVPVIPTVVTKVEWRFS